MLRVLIAVLMLGTVSFSSQAKAWTEVASDMVFTDGLTMHRLVFKNPTVPYQEVMLQILNPEGARILNTVLTTKDSGQFFMGRLDGDYGFGMRKVDRFPRNYVRALSFYVQSLQPRRPVRFRVMMR